LFGGWCFFWLLLFGHYLEFGRLVFLNDGKKSAASLWRYLEFGGAVFLNGGKKPPLRRLGV